MKRVSTLMLAIALCLILCGCNMFVFDTDNILSPPELSGELKPIQQALVESIKGEYTLKYPTYGEIKSAVVTEDLDGDGIKEAFAFYSTSDSEETMMHLNVIVKDKKKYKSVDDNSKSASGIERIDFYDLNGDGKKEIIVGWEIYAESEKQLAVYQFEKNALTQIMSQKYTNYLCIDFDDNGKNEILVQDLDTKESTNKASLYSITENGLTQISGCLLDGKVKTAGRFKLSSLSNGQKAVYIDEIKGIGAVTEVLFMSKGELKNPLLDVENTMENVKTIRSATIPSADVNNDGIIEIPMASDMPNADFNSDEKLYYTNWCSFSGDVLTVKQVSVVNTADGYSINLPKRFIGNIAASKNVDKRTRTVYLYDNELQIIGQRVVTFKAYDKTEYEESEIKKSNNIKVFSKDNTIVVAETFDIGQELGLTSEELENILSFNAF
ncbi:MAG: VCBS repeat-containing protein [Clostridia bacterium]|nr:VCBS repeat-containing protein [Clostridia bacterium]